MNLFVVPLSGGGFSMSKQRLASCDAVFRKFFNPWYDAADRKRRGFTATRPDMLQDPGRIGMRASDLCVFDGEFQGNVLKQIDRMAKVAKSEWPYWESALFYSKTGHVIPTFHWAIKKFSGYGIDDGLIGKLGCCLHVLSQTAKRRPRR